MADKQPSIAMSEVKSSNVAKLGYDAPTQRMAVQFKSGATYHYHGVGAKTADAVTSAKSVGSAVSSMLVKGGFKFERIGE
jgi:hypothetical protein